MYQIQLKFKGESQKITTAKAPPPSELHKLITQCFSLQERVLGVTDKKGKFYELAQLDSRLVNNYNGSFNLVTAKDINEDNMSFGKSTHS